MSDLASDLASDDYLTALKGVRNAIIFDLATCEQMRDRAALYVRLESVLKLIEAATPATVKVGDPVDEIASRRASRGAVAAPVQHRPAAH